MKKYKLIPSSAAGGTSWTNIENAYTDTDSDTYAAIGVSATNRFQLRGFDFSEIPSTATVLSIEIKAKYSSDTTAQVKESINGYGLTNQITAGVSSLVYTFTMSKTISEFLSYKDNIYIEFYQTDSAQIRVYGAEINIVTDEPVPNKVSYGNKTLIDLTSDTAIASDVLNGKTFHLSSGEQTIGTCNYNCNTSSDTATASDVASGKTFHLASGVQATGTLSTNVKKVTKKLSMNGTSITFTGLSNEPKCFIVRVKDNISYNSSTSNYKIVYVTYDGTNTTGAYLRGGTNTSTSGVIYNTTKYSFTYSSRSLTVSSSGSSTSAGGGFIIGEWELIYAY